MLQNVMVECVFLVLSLLIPWTYQAWKECRSFFYKLRTKRNTDKVERAMRDIARGNPNRGYGY